MLEPNAGPLTRGAGNPPRLDLGLFAAGLSVGGALTVIGAGKRALEGELAFALFLSVTGPLALVVLHRYGRGRRIAGHALTTWSLAFLLGLTMVAGMITGSAFGADIALGLTLALGALVVGWTAVSVAGVMIAVATAALYLIEADEAFVPLTTGTILVAAGGLARRQIRERESASAQPTEVPRVEVLRLAAIPPGDDGRAAAICARAFDADPAMRALLRRDRSRHAALALWFRGLLRIARRYGGREVVGAYLGERLIAVCVTFGPGRYPAPIRGTLLAAPGPLRGGPLVAWRAMRWLLARDHHHPSAAHIYLETLATDPAFQRQGSGAALLAHLCDEADRQRLPVALYTNNRSNIGYYARFGFAVQREAMLLTGAAEWLMWRAPSRPAG